ncbi:conserved protein of unknown function [Streptomyces murinus]
MFTRPKNNSAGAHPKSGTVGGIVRPFTASSLCLFQRNHVPAVMTGDGVSTYLALTFGTLLSSQGTVASFVLTLSGFPPGFPSVFQTLSGFFCLSDHRSASMQKEIQSQDPKSLFSVRARTLSRRSVPSRSTTVQGARNGMQIRRVGGLDH